MGILWPFDLKQFNSIYKKIPFHCRKRKIFLLPVLSPAPCGWISNLEVGSNRVLELAYARTEGLKFYSLLFGFVGSSVGDLSFPYNMIPAQRQSENVARLTYT